MLRSCFPGIVFLFASACAPVREDALEPARGESGALRTNLYLQDDPTILGRPIRLRLELKNEGRSSLSIDAQQVGVNRSLDVLGPDGKPVPYIYGPV